MTPRMPVQLYAAALLLVAALVWASSAGGMLVAAAGLVLVLGLVALSLLGAHRAGVLVLMGAYFTAPFYKGVAIGGAASLVTATDLLLFAGFALLLPELTRGRVRFPASYVVGVGIVLVCGLLSSALSPRYLESFIAVAFWMIVMIGLPIAFALWGPLARQIDLLAASFVAGQAFSLVLGIAQGNEAMGRQAGLSTHPNYLAQSGVMAVCLLLYLAHRHLGRTVLITTALAAGGLIAATSVWMSGSRAGTVVVAVLVLMIPFVERSAVGGFVMAALGALGLLLLPYLASLAGPNSVLARLAGDTSAQYATSARSLGLESGVERFWEHPLLGSGLVDLFDIHNNFLEVAVGIGILGLVGYLLVLYALARPLFGNHAHRRLAYAVWAYIGFGATVPSLYDRSVWAVVALGAIPMALAARERTAPTAPTAATARTTARPTAPTPAGAAPAPRVPAADPRSNS